MYYRLKELEKQCLNTCIKLLVANEWNLVSTIASSPWSIRIGKDCYAEG
jgi:hypothetical protein